MKTIVCVNKINNIKGKKDLVSLKDKTYVMKLSDKKKDSYKEIYKVVITFYGDTATSKGFTWYTNKYSVNSNIQLIEQSKEEKDFSKWLKFVGTCYKSTWSQEELVHKGQVTMLKPDTSYFFRVGDEKLNIWSEIGTFRTASKKAPFTFIDIADTQVKYKEEAKLSWQTLEKALKVEKNPAFISLNGDWVNKGRIEEQWDWLFGYFKYALLNNTFVPVPGNHEKDENAFMDHFNLKGEIDAITKKGVYYSFDYVNTHFIVLNNNEKSDEYCGFTPSQIEWMNNDVKRAKNRGYKWIIVMMHKGPYTTSKHATSNGIIGEKGIRTLVAPLIENLGVDLILQGHDHIYARTKAIRNGVSVEETKIMEIVNGIRIEYTINPKGSIYLIPNTAGAKVYLKNKEIDSNYFDLFEVSDENHAAKYMKEPEETSKKIRGLVQNFVVITVDENKLTSIVYEIDKNKNNGNSFIIDKFGIIKN